MKLNAFKNGKSDLRKHILFDYTQKKKDIKCILTQQIMSFSSLSNSPKILMFNGFKWVTPVN
ncbi:MAG: hypothetical protein RLZZ66_2311 [Pseudomonadota bacterium]|jgi:hypothetical protein